MKNKGNLVPQKSQVLAGTTTNTSVSSSAQGVANSTVIYYPNEYVTTPLTPPTYPNTNLNLRDFKDFTIGFERQWGILETISTTIAKSTYPPYNIIKVDEDKYVVEIALAGFSKKEVTVVQREQTLTVSGEKSKSEKDDDTVYTHKGIGARNFTHTFALADYVDVTSAELLDGILTITLIREYPEEKKPRNIAVK